MKRALDAVGTKTRLLEIPGGGHIFNRGADGGSWELPLTSIDTPEAQAAMIDFLDHTIGPTAMSDRSRSRSRPRLVRRRRVRRRTRTTRRVLEHAIAVALPSLDTGRGVAAATSAGSRQRSCRP